MLEAHADALEQSEGAGVGAMFDAEHLPPGAASWRAVLEAGRRGELEVTRIGRRAVVTQAAWSAYVERRSKRHKVEIAPGDAELLAAMAGRPGLRVVGGAR